MITEYYKRLQYQAIYIIILCLKKLKIECKFLHPHRYKGKLKAGEMANKLEIGS